MKVNYLGHSSFLISGKTNTGEEISVITDPFDPKAVGLSYAKQKADIVTISHIHPDHFFLNNIEGEEFNKIEVDSGSYKINKAYLEMQKVQNAELFQQGKLILYDDAPAINAGLDGVIMEINGVKITDVEKLGKELEKYAPGDEIKIKVKNDEEILEHLIVLGKTPANPSKAWLGVGFIDRQGRGILSKTYILLASFKKEHVYYEPKFEVSLFIYNLLWWVILISISVALVNMLPAGIFDGGRFFYLTVLAFVKNEKTANKISSWATKVFLILILLLMIFWGISFI